MMLISCILPAVEVVYIVTVLAPCVITPVRYAVRNRAHTIVKPCPNRVQTMSPFAHAPSGVIDQTLINPLPPSPKKRSRSPCYLTERHQSIQGHFWRSDN